MSSSVGGGGRAEGLQSEDIIAFGWHFIAISNYPIQYSQIEICTRVTHVVATNIQVLLPATARVGLSYCLSFLSPKRTLLDARVSTQNVSADSSLKKRSRGCPSHHISNDHTTPHLLPNALSFLACTLKNGDVHCSVRFNFFFFFAGNLQQFYIKHLDRQLSFAYHLDVPEHVASHYFHQDANETLSLAPPKTSMPEITSDREDGNRTICHKLESR